MITMTRRVSFACAMANWIFAASDEENRLRLGPRASAEPFGASFVLDVSVRGEIDGRTGILVNIKDIDQIVRERIVRRLDGRYLNQAVPEFAGRAVTPATIALFAEQALDGHMPACAALSGIRLEVLSGSRVTLTHSPTAGKEKELEVTHSYEFSASHRLDSPALSPQENQELFGKCNYENGHGHNYVLEVTVAGPIDETSGRVIDPVALDAIVNQRVVDRYDHRHLNKDIDEFRETIPSAEVITRAIWDQLAGHIPAPARLRRVHLKETARNLFEYSGEDSAE